MKTSYNVRPILENDKFIGFTLPADYTAEHEWGIKDMQSKFNIKKTSEKEFVEKKKTLFSKFKKFPFGIPLSNDSATLSMFQENGYVYLTSYTHIMERELEAEMFSHIIHLDDSKDYFGAWDGEDFLIVAKKEKASFLEELFDSEENNDLFVGSIKDLSDGLFIAIGNNIPKNYKDEYIGEQEVNIETYQRALDSGIEKDLKNAGKKWLALSPKIIKGELKFWLNPYYQQIDNSGWYSIGELREWRSDEGPIPMKKEA